MAAENPHLLVLGGARSGKSSYALDLAEKNHLKGYAGNNKGLFIATAQALDKEMELRISIHKKQRGGNWLTLEEPFHLAHALEDEAKGFRVIMVDCLTMWLSNVVLSDNMDADREIVRLADVLRKISVPVVMVSNEVGMGLVPENALGRRFRDLQGSLNQKIASLCATVIFMAAGLPLILKGSLSHPDSF